MQMNHNCVGSTSAVGPTVLLCTAAESDALHCFTTPCGSQHATHCSGALFYYRAVDHHATYFLCVTVLVWKHIRQPLAAAKHHHSRMDSHRVKIMSTVKDDRIETLERRVRQLELKLESHFFTSSLDGRTVLASSATFARCRKARTK